MQIIVPGCHSWQGLKLGNPSRNVRGARKDRRSPAPQAQSIPTGGGAARELDKVGLIGANERGVPYLARTHGCRNSQAVSEEELKAEASLAQAGAGLGQAMDARAECRVTAYSYR